METHISDKRRALSGRLGGLLAQWILIAIAGSLIPRAEAQDLQEQIRRLSDAMAQTQAQLEQSQRQLEQMRAELTALQRQAADGKSSATRDEKSAAPQPSGTSPNVVAEIEELREHQTVEETQIATHEQSKIESASKYPVKLTGLVLFNSFVNTKQVDSAVTPTLALPGAGSTGASIRQTVLGFDARGPHILGAESYADLRIDFAGTSRAASAGASNLGPYSTSFLRLRTAHAGLRWSRTTAAFSLDRPILSPETPTSLTAVAEPALAWSGNLWTWNPQVGITHDIEIGGPAALRVQAALIDVNDPPYSPIPTASGTSSVDAPSGAEQSRWPGVESRIALMGIADPQAEGNRVGVGGYFSPHRSALNYNFDSWAVSMDTHLRLPLRLQISSSAYRGLGLGGLGGGAYKDFAYRYGADTGELYVRALDDVGGWAQLKEKFNEKIELNAAYGMDEVFAHEMQRYAFTGGTVYRNLLANRTYTANAIYSPSAYLLFSLEYRHIESKPVAGSAASSDVIGVAAGYRF